MRDAFFKTLVGVAESDDRINLVVGDLGFGAVDPFVKRFPDRFLNAGVAEQNMTGLAAGMALSGKTVLTYSIANFPTLRCLEQIRNDVCYHNANVKVVSVGGGLAYGALGMTHHATEDLAIMRVLPRMVVVAPADPWEVARATRAICRYEGPCYLRLGRAGEKSIERNEGPFELGKAFQVREGSDLTLISTGSMLSIAVDVAEHLSREKITVRVLSMHTISPLDSDAVLTAASETKGIVTLEEHSVVGGLGGAVSEILAESDTPKVPFKRLGLPPKFSSQVGSQDFLRAANGLSKEGILEVLKPILDLIRKKR